jgi:hypothetical protein
MYDQEGPQKTSEPRELGLVGANLSSAKEQAPMANAFTSQEKAIAELGMMVEQLERRLDPISTRYDEPNKTPADNPEKPTSEIVRAINQNTDQIRRLSEKVRRITNELEV